MRSIESTELSDTGRRRQYNEDTCLRLPDHGVFCVADGMGGVVGGDLASEAITTRLHEVFTKAGPGEEPNLSARIALFQKALDQASQWIKRFADQKGIKQMGSTVVALLFDPREPCRAIGLHAGDSRLYRYRAGLLKLLTSDHTAMAVLSAKLGWPRGSVPAKFQNGLMRAVGLTETVDLEQTSIDVRSGDLFLLCSDGLSRMLSDSAIATILGKHAREVIGTQAKMLVDAANAAGGKDNITVILVRAAEAEGETVSASGDSATTQNTVLAGALNHLPETCYTIQAGQSDTVPAGELLPEAPQGAPAQEPATGPTPLAIQQRDKRLRTIAVVLLISSLLVAGAIWVQARRRRGIAASAKPKVSLNAGSAAANLGENALREKGPGRTWTNELGIAFVEVAKNRFWLGTERITAAQYKHIVGTPPTGLLFGKADELEAAARVTYSEAREFVDRLNRGLRIAGALPMDYETGHLALPTTNQWMAAMAASAALDPRIQALDGAAEWCVGGGEQGIEASVVQAVNRPKFTQSSENQEDRLALRLVLVP
ncbi:MAG: PP2C family protein-serine/threonine phosphatase [Limisphaerales bacterium]